jgi:hypothetical protein
MAQSPSGGGLLLAMMGFDNLGGHWVVSTEEDAAGKAKRRNCKMCHLKGKADLKSVFMCEKCEVPLHTHCFKPYHTKSVGEP